MTATTTPDAATFDAACAAAWAWIGDDGVTWADAHDGRKDIVRAAIAAALATITAAIESEATP